MGTRTSRIARETHAEAVRRNANGSVLAADSVVAAREAADEHAKRLEELEAARAAAQKHASESVRRAEEASACSGTAVRFALLALSPSALR